MAKSEGSQKGTEFASMLNQTLRLMKEHANEKLSGEGFEEKTDYGAKLQESTPGAAQKMAISESESCSLFVLLPNLCASATL